MELEKLVKLKAAIVAQLNEKNSSENFVEAWKQAYRTEKAKLIAHKRLCNDVIARFALKNHLKAINQTETKSVEELFQDLLSEINKNRPVEEWKRNYVQNRVKTFHGRHAVLNEINAKKFVLKSRPKTNFQLRKELLESIRNLDKSNHIISSLKQTIIDQRCSTIATKRKINIDEQVRNNQYIHNKT